MCVLIFLGKKLIFCEEGSLYTVASLKGVKKMGAMPEWTMLLANVGFPSAVAVYLLLRFEKQIAAQTLAIEDLTRKLETKNEEDN